jgi:hypothetical protein
VEGEEEEGGQSRRGRRESAPQSWRGGRRRLFLGRKIQKTKWGNKIGFTR